MTFSRPHSWAETKIGDITEVIMGQSPPGDTYNSIGDGLPFYQGKSDFGVDSPTPSKWCATPTRIAEAGDILISVRAPVGPTNIASERCGIGRGLSAIRVLPEVVEPYFLLYYLRQYEPKLASRSTGSTFASINREDIENIGIPLLPLSEQKRIVAILRHAANLLRQRRETDDLAQNLLPALFTQMFGDLHTSKHIKMLPLKDVADVVSGVAKGRRLSDSVEVPYLRVANVQAGYLDLSEIKTIMASPSEVKELELKKGDVLLTEGGDFDKLGRGAMLEVDLPNTIHQNHVFRVRVNQEFVQPVFFANYLQTPFAKSYFLRAGKKTTNLASINLTQLKNLPVPLPSLKLQEIFDERLAIIRQIENEQKSGGNSLENLFYTLSSRAFTGKLTEVWREQNKDQLSSEIEKRDEWLKGHGVQRAVVTEAILIEPPPIIDDPLLSQLSPAQQRVYAIVQSHSAAYFTLQTLWESQNDEDQHLDRDVLERGLTLLESLGVILRVSIPVSPVGETFYQNAYRRVRFSSNIAFASISDFEKQVFSTLLKINDEHHRALLLGDFVPYLSDEFKSQAFTAVLTIKDEYSRATGLANLFLYLNDELRVQALTATREIKDQYYRATAMTTLASHLNAENKLQVLQEALASARAIENERYRAQALTALIPHLPDDLKSQVLQEAFVSARAIQDNFEYVYELMINLAPYLNEENKELAFQEAFVAARTINDVSERARKLANLAANLKEENKEQALREAYAAVLAIEDEHNRVYALVSLVPHLPDELKLHVFETIRAIKRQYLISIILAALAKYSPKELNPQVLEAARAIQDESGRTQVLISLAPHLPDDLKSQVLQEAFVSARAIQDETDRVRALVSLAPHITDELKPHVLQEAFVAALKIKEEILRANILSFLAPHLAKEGKEQAYQEAFEAALKIKSESDRVHALTSLAPDLNEEGREQAYQGAFVAALKIKEERSRVYVLADLAPHLSEKRKEQALQEAFAAALKVKKASERAETLAILVRYLNDEFKPSTPTFLEAELRALKDRFPNIRL